MRRKGGLKVLYVVISEKGGAERREAFDKMVVTVGRVQDNDLTLAKGNVSKRHCRIEMSEGRIVVTDEDSTNGTYVNRRRIAAPTIVREGDRIYVGDFVLRVETTPGAEGEQLSQPIAPAVPPIPPILVPLSPERDVDAEFMRTTAPSESVRSPLGHPPVKNARRQEHTSAFPVATSDLVVPAPVSSVAGGVERSAARTLIEEVWRRLEAHALERSIDSETADRVSRILAEQVTQLPALGHALTPSGTEAAVALARSELFGLGPLEPWLDDARVTDIAVVGAKRLQVSRDGSQQTVSPFCHPESVEWALFRLCRQSNTELSEHEGVVQRVLRPSGLRLQAVRGSVAPGGALVRLSRPELSAVEVDDLVHVGTLSRTMATFLKHCMMARLNVLIVGKPQSGYQELLSALSSLASPPLAWLSWSSETLRPPVGLDCHRIHWPAAEEPGHVLDLLLHMGQRVVVPNPPSSALRKLTQAVASGLDGVLVAQEGTSSEVTLAHWSHLLATREVGVAEAYRLLTRSVDLVIEVARLGDGRSRVLRVAEFRPRDSALRDIFDFVVERTASGGSIEGHFRSVGEPPALVTTLRARGVVVDESLFLRPPSE